MWTTNLCKGTALYNAFFKNDQDAGSIFEPPRPSAHSGWTADHLPQWGYHGQWHVDQSWRDLGTHGSMSYGIARALRELEISDEDTDDGGRLRTVAIWHRNPYVDTPLEQQSYAGPDGVVRRHTGSLALFAYGITDRVIINLNTRSPQHAAQDVNPPVPADQLPHLRSLSDLLWAVWSAYAGPGNQLNWLKWWFRVTINNVDTRRIIKRVLDSQPRAEDRDLKPFPGIWISTTTEAGRALLGTPLGRSLGYFLVQHKSSLDNMWVDGAYIFQGDSTWGHACLAFHIREPQARQTIEGEPGFRNDTIPEPELPSNGTIAEMLKKREDVRGEMGDEADGDWFD
ncbi:hypothetical protein N0V90_011445 [Kalmusia sp. IMI 367209]|nr:hypothetical protein N0V90_011445 [Kalmusia sp. IMI 367209]